MKKICKSLKISSQGFYKSRKKKQVKILKEEMVLKLASAQRRKLPRLGGRKLYKKLKPDLDKMGIKLGRDKLFRLLKKHGLLIQKKKRYAKTTNSSHGFGIYANLIKEKEAVRTDEVYVSDITYIGSLEGFSYLALVTDLHSRKIVGFDISDSLNLEGSLRALKMAIKGKTLTGSIHHSDRGIQYCSKAYTELLKANGIKISMSEKGNPYENAVAERINGILKEEFLLDQIFKTKQDIIKAVKEAIASYNELRPHMSLNYMTPNQKYAA